MKKATLSFLTAKVDGFDFVIFEPKEHIQVSWKLEMYYEPDMIEFIHRNYKGGTFVDIGACIGNHTLAFSRVADRVVAFEPMPQVFIHLLSNIVLNKITNTIAYNIALGNKKGVERMVFVKGSAGGGEVRKNGNYSVPILRLDDFKLKNVTLIKIDVQEQEAQVLNGAKNTIKTNKPDIFIECNTTLDEVFTLEFLKEIDERYEQYPESFCPSPSYLFTTKKLDTFKRNIKYRRDKNDN